MQWARLHPTTSSEWRHLTHKERMLVPPLSPPAPMRSECLVAKP